MAEQIKNDMEKLAKAGEERLQALKGINNDAKRTLKPNGLADRLDHAIYGLYSFVEHGVKTKKFGTQKQLQKALQEKHILIGKSNQILATKCILICLIAVVLHPLRFPLYIIHFLGMYGACYLYQTKFLQNKRLIEFYEQGVIAVIITFCVHFFPSFPFIPILKSIGYGVIITLLGLAFKLFDLAFREKK